jgi:hypothetical protein
MKKMSYASAIDFALSRLTGEDSEIVFHDDDLGTSHDVTLGEVRETLERCRESHMKRNTRKTGPTKAQIANAEIGEAVIAAMEQGTVYTIADVSALVPALAGATPQKVGPICRKLAAAGRLTEGKVKGKVTYSLA